MYQSEATRYNALDISQRVCVRVNCCCCHFVRQLLMIMSFLLFNFTAMPICRTIWLSDNAFTILINNRLISAHHTVGGRPANLKFSRENILFFFAIIQCVAIETSGLRTHTHSENKQIQDKFILFKDSWCASTSIKLH